MVYRSVKSRLKTISEKTSLDPSVKQQIRNRLEIEMAKEDAEPSRSSRSTLRRKLPAMAAVVLPLTAIIGAVGYWASLGIHIPQKTVAAVNTATTNRTVAINHRITIDDIKSYYAHSDQPTSRILNIKSYPKYHAVIVESHIDVPNLKVPNDFEWWDMDTGKHFVLVGRPTYAQLKQVVSAEEVVFLASGKNSEGSEVRFPYYVYANRANPNSDFTITNKPALLSIEKSVSFGDFKLEAVSKVTASPDSVKMNFSPLSKNGGNFYAGSTGAPAISTVYIQSKNEMMLRFKKTRFTVSTAELQSVHNAFVQGVSAHMNGTELDVTLHLTQKARFYTASVDHVQHPSLTITFTNHNESLG